MKSVNRLRLDQNANGNVEWSEPAIQFECATAANENVHPRSAKSFEGNSGGGRINFINHRNIYHSKYHKIANFNKKEKVEIKQDQKTRQSRKLKNN